MQYKRIKKEELENYPDAMIVGMYIDGKEVHVDSKSYDSYSSITGNQCVVYRNGMDAGHADGVTEYEIEL